VMIARAQPMLLPADTAEEWSLQLRGDEFAPAESVVPLELATPFGSFRQWVEAPAADGRVVVRRSLRLPAQRVEAADYPAFRSFCGAVDAAVDAPIALVPPASAR
jgi:hypothetical protein